MWISLHKSALSRHTVWRLSVVLITIYFHSDSLWCGRMCRYYFDFVPFDKSSRSTRSNRCDSIFSSLALAANEPPNKINIIIIVVITFFIWILILLTTCVAVSSPIGVCCCQFIIQIRKTFSTANYTEKSSQMAFELWAVIEQNIRFRKTEIESVENRQQDERSLNFTRHCPTPLARLMKCTIAFPLPVGNFACIYFDF